MQRGHQIEPLIHVLEKKKKGVVCRQGSFSSPATIFRAALTMTDDISCLGNFHFIKMGEG